MADMKVEPAKTFQKAGKWIEKKTRSEVFVCTCGNKYLKTRPKQATCLLCTRNSKHR